MVTDLADSLEPTADDRLEQAEALVRSYCGWHIAPSRAETFSVRVAREAAILLPSLHVTDVSSVTRDGTTLEADTYWWTSAGVVTGVEAGCWYGQVVVSFEHGYDDAPPDVTAVVQAIAQRAVDNPRSLIRKRVGPFEDGYSQTGSNQALPLALLGGERDVLDRYRIFNRP